MIVLEVLAMCPRVPADGDFDIEIPIQETPELVEVRTALTKPMIPGLVVVGAWFSNFRLNTVNVRFHAEERCNGGDQGLAITLLQDGDAIEETSDGDTEPPDDDADNADDDLKI